jgi:hypothetical protein
VERQNLNKHIACKGPKIGQCRRLS